MKYSFTIVSTLIASLSLVSAAPNIAKVTGQLLVTGATSAATHSGVTALFERADVGKITIDKNTLTDTSLDFTINYQPTSGTFCIQLKDNLVKFEKDNLFNTNVDGDVKFIDGLGGNQVCPGAPRKLNFVPKTSFRELCKDKDLTAKLNIEDKNDVKLDMKLCDQLPK